MLNKFKSGQIVCLESNQGFLYGEVIQNIAQRQICWVRPLIVTVTEEQDSFVTEANQKIIDLRSASDLLLPLSLFRVSYDTEVVDLLMELATRKQSEDSLQISSYLNQFIKQVWIDNQNIFQASEFNSKSE